MNGKITCSLCKPLNKFKLNDVLSSNILGLFGIILEKMECLIGIYPTKIQNSLIYFNFQYICHK